MEKAEKIKKFWNESCEDYDHHMSETDHYKAQIKILGLLKKEIKEPILDLACGTGIILKFLSNDFSNIQGNDFSKKMIEMSKEKLTCKLTEENAEILSSYDEKFNTVILCNLFFYIENRKKAVKRWKKLLEKDGKIIFLEEHPFLITKSDDLDKHTKDLLEILNPISPEEIEKIMVEEGFFLKKKVKTSIDGKHDLYGLVFSLN